MKGGYVKTVRTLVRSNNRAASELLNRALSSSHEGVRRAACTEIISSKGSKLLLEFIRNIDSIDDMISEILAESPGKLSNPIRSALLSKERILQKNAVRAALVYRVYDLIPILLNMLTAEKTEHRPGPDIPIDELLIRLTKQFVDDIEENRTGDTLRALVINETTAALHRIIRNFRRNDDPIFLKIFLLLGPYIHEKDLKQNQAFRNPLHPIYAALAGILQTEKDEYIYEFILDSLHAQNVPGLVLSAISNRTDPDFLQYFLEGLESPFPAAVQDNVARIHRLEWINSVRSLLKDLDPKAQSNLVELLHCSRLPREEIFTVCQQIVQFGCPSGRCAALVELSASALEEVDNIIWENSGDSDPEVRATALKLLRARNHPQASVRLLQNIDNPSKIVREVVQEMLPEFRIQRFLASFDLLNEQQRKLTFKIVKKIDPRTNEVLIQELHEGNPAAKVRAIRCIEIGELVPQMEEPLCSLLLHGEPAPLRMKAAELLATGRREISRLSLIQASHNDKSFDVRIVAKSSLEKREEQREKEKVKQ